MYITSLHHVEILNSDLIRYFWEGVGHFDCPQHIACDNTGNVYVADWGNHRIQVFTAEGMFLRMFGRHGKGRGELQDSRGVAVDSSGRVMSVIIGIAVSLYSPQMVSLCRHLAAREVDEDNLCFLVNWQWTVVE